MSVPEKDPYSMFPESSKSVAKRLHEEALQELEEEKKKASGNLTAPDQTHQAISLARKLMGRSREVPKSPTYRLGALLGIENVVAAWNRDPNVASSLSPEERHDMILTLSESYEALALSAVEPELRRLALHRAVQLRGDLEDLGLGDYSGKSPVEKAGKLSLLWEAMYNVLKLPEDLDTAIRILERVSSKANGEDLQAIEAHIRTLRLRRGDKFPVVFDIPFESISEGPISLAEIPSRRYRFIDARSLADGARLRVLDFEALPEKRYVAMSYVWRGIPPPKGTEPGPTLAIEGASNADPISIDILQIACRATLHMNCNLLWIDGFCIKQGDDDDKAWQIQRMYSIYQHCHACLILPGGLSRLVRLDEETSWVRRAWTLQEALAPSRCEVLYSWTDGPCCLQAIFPAYVDVIVPGRAAMSNMRQLLDISIRGEYYITTLNGDMSSERYPIRLLVNGTEDSVHLHSLIGALDLQGTDGAPSAIWRAAVMRTAYRPVDMVFSIMGLFGVDLDPSKYTASDRTLALVDMMRKLLAKGGRAEWLAIVPQITPGKDLSVLPIIPKPSASGSGLVISEEIGEINASRAAGGLIWWLRNTPRGSIDAEGFLTITAPAISVTRIPVQSDGVPTETHEVKFQDYQGNPWTLAPNPRGCGPYAAKIGNKQNYLSGAYGTWIDKRSVMVMLVDDGYQGGLRILGYAAVVEELTQLPGWKDKVLRLK